MADLMVNTFNLERSGNYLDEATRGKTGNNILYRSAEDTLDDSEIFRTITTQLLEYRGRRIRPLLDDKVLTDWNGLMIAALARCGMVLKDQGLICRAEKCVQFIKEYMMPKPGRLLHRWREEEAGIPGFLDDYAYMIKGLLALYEATGKEEYCTLALTLCRTVLTEFRSESGDFFMVARGGEPLLLRPTQPFDSAIPSGNGVMMMNLLRLARITGDSELEAAGHQVIQHYAGGIWNYPDGLSAALSAFDYALGPSTEVVVSGDNNSDDVQAALSALRAVYAPNSVILSCPDFGGTTDFAIHMCSGHTCEPPIQDLRTALARIVKST